MPTAQASRTRRTPAVGRPRPRRRRPPPGMRADSRPSGRQGGAVRDVLRRTPAGPRCPGPDTVTSPADAACAPSSPPTASTANGCSVIGHGAERNGHRHLRRRATTEGAERDPDRTAGSATRRLGATVPRFRRGAHQTISTLSATALPPPRQSVARPGRAPAILQRVEQRRQHAGAARADRMAERDRAAVHVDAVPVPAQPPAVGERLRRERLVRLDQIVVADRWCRSSPSGSARRGSARRRDPAARRRPSRSR